MVMEVLQQFNITYAPPTSISKGDVFSKLQSNNYWPMEVKHAGPGSRAV
jgi:hypothetical protein